MMLRLATCCAFLLGALALPPSHAQDAPSPQEARRFLDFYYNGQDRGVVLADVRVCTDVPRDGDQAYACVGEVAPDAVQTDQSYYLRMVFVVPQGLEDVPIAVRYIRQGTPRDMDEVTVSGSIRYRTWTVFTLREAGPWQFQIARVTDTGTEGLRTLDVQAQAGDE